MLVNSILLSFSERPVKLLKAVIDNDLGGAERARTRDPDRKNIDSVESQTIVKFFDFPNLESKWLLFIFIS